ncbi:hypothetical protein GOBAR_DD26694 [Gossypium barbadense]|nr:hypothetical protein GOBAR_DD26694 [Gossypium barbadense]
MFPVGTRTIFLKKENGTYTLIGRGVGIVVIPPEVDSLGESFELSFSPPNRRSFSLGVEASIEWNSLILALLVNSKLIQCNITYDNKAILISGQRRILISDFIHYHGSTPGMWKDLINKAKDEGLDAVDTYAFWNGHEPFPGNGTSNEFKVMANDQYTYDSTMEEPTMDGPFITTSYDYDAPIDEYGPCILSKARKLCNFSWETYNEDISSLGESSRITVPGLLEHLNVTSYLWYTTSVDISLLESFLRGGRKSTLDVNSVGHALHVFINGQ